VARPPPLSAATSSPFAALGAGPQAAGRRVTIATHGSLPGFAESAGLGFAPLPVEFAADRPLTPGR
jgi:UDP:flavonoid glycosyltransferase YjiC (YdhE family)